MDSHKPQRGEREANQGSKEDGETLPPSSNTSPSQDFSFAISVLPSSISSPNPIKCNKTTPSTAVDMAPADDIFFHGHLLPLHFVSYSSISPRPSDISIEDLSLPLEHLSSDGSLKYQNNYRHNNTESGETRERTKFKSLSSFFGLVKWRKGSNTGEKEENNNKNKKKKKKKGIDVMSRFLKKYVTMPELFFFFKEKREKRDLRRRPYSISGHSNTKERVGWRRRGGEFSAPASMRTSPTNSGLLSAYSDVSTMEELQSAIQAAIAHCKNSTAPKEEK